MSSVPAQFYCRLQHGIRGGFAPPTPREVHVISRGVDNSQTLLIQSEIRETGTPDLSALQPKNVPVSSSESQIAELHDILKRIPTEQPPGSEDIYGLDTQIAWGSDDLEWMNGGPQGCGDGQSEVQPTEEDKRLFKRAVEIVETLAKGQH